MPPDRFLLRRLPRMARAERVDRNIPQLRLVETNEVHDRTVNMQMGAFIAAPVLGIVLVCRPEAKDVALAAMVTLTAALRRSYFRHRHLRVT